MANNARVLLAATVTDVGDGPFVYPACQQCYSKLVVLRQQECQLYQCQNCKCIHSHCQENYRYRLCLTVTDSTTLASVTAFGGMLNSFFGVTATEFHNIYVAGVREKYGSSCENIVQVAIEQAFVGQNLLFGLKITTSGTRQKQAKTVSARCLTLRDVCQNSGMPLQKSTSRHLPEIIAVQILRQTDSAFGVTVVECLLQLQILIEEYHLSQDVCSDRAALLRVVNSYPRQNCYDSFMSSILMGDTTMSGDTCPMHDITLKSSTDPDQSSVGFSCDSSLEENSMIENPDLTVSGHQCPKVTSVCLHSSDVSSVTSNEFFEIDQNEIKCANFCAFSLKDEAKRPLIKESVKVKEMKTKCVDEDKYRNCVGLHETRFENTEKLINTEAHSNTKHSKTTKIPFGKSDISRDNLVHSSLGDKSEQTQCDTHRHVRACSFRTNLEAVSSEDKENSGHELCRNSSWHVRHSWKPKLSSNRLLLDTTNKKSLGDMRKQKKQLTENEGFHINNVQNNRKVSDIQNCGKVKDIQNRGNRNLNSSSHKRDSSYLTAEKCGESSRCTRRSATDRSALSQIKIFESTVNSQPLSACHLDQSSITSFTCKDSSYDWDTSSLNRHFKFGQTMYVHSKDIANKDHRGGEPDTNLDGMNISQKISLVTSSVPDICHQVRSNLPEENKVLEETLEDCYKEHALGFEELMENYPESEGFDLFVSKFYNSFKNDNENIQCRSINQEKITDNKGKEIAGCTASRDSKKNALPDKHVLCGSDQGSCALGRTLIDTSVTPDKLSPLPTTFCSGADNTGRRTFTQNFRIRRKQTPSLKIENTKKMTLYEKIENPRKQTLSQNSKISKKITLSQNVNKYKKETLTKQTLSQNVKSTKTQTLSLKVESKEKQIFSQKTKNVKHQTLSQKDKNTQKQTLFQNVKNHEKLPFSQTVKNRNKPTVIQNIENTEKQSVSYTCKNLHKKTFFQNIKVQKKQTQCKNVKKPVQKTWSQSLKYPEKQQTSSHSVKVLEKDTLSQNTKKPKKFTLSQHIKNTEKQIISYNVKNCEKHTLSQTVNNPKEKCHKLSVNTPSASYARESHVADKDCHIPATVTLRRGKRKCYTEMADNTYSMDVGVEKLRCTDINIKKLCERNITEFLCNSRITLTGKQNGDNSVTSHTDHGDKSEQFFQYMGGVSIVNCDEGFQKCVIEQNGDSVKLTNKNGDRQEVMEQYGDMVEVIEQNGDTVKFMELNGDTVEVTELNGGIVEVTELNDGTEEVMEQNGGTIEDTELNGDSLVIREPTVDHIADMDKMSPFLSRKPSSTSFTLPVSQQVEMKDIELCNTRNHDVFSASDPEKNMSVLKKYLSMDIFSNSADLRLGVSCCDIGHLNCGGVSTTSHNINFSEQNNIASKTTEHTAEVTEQKDHVTGQNDDVTEQKDHVAGQNADVTEQKDNITRQNDNTEKDTEKNVETIEITEQNSPTAKVTEQTDLKEFVTKQTDLKEFVTKQTDLKEFVTEQTDLKAFVTEQDDYVSERDNDIYTKQQNTADIQTPVAVVARSLQESEESDSEFWCQSPTPQKPTLTKSQAGKFLGCALRKLKASRDSNTCIKTLQYGEQASADMPSRCESPQFKKEVSENLLSDTSCDLFSSQDESFPFVGDDDSHRQQKICERVTQRSPLLYLSHTTSDDLHIGYSQPHAEKSLAKKKVRFSNRKQEHFFFNFEIISHLPVVNKVRMDLKSSLKRSSRESSGSQDLFSEPSGSQDLFSEPSQDMASGDLSLEMESGFQSPTELWDSSHELFSQSPIQSVTQTVESDFKSPTKIWDSSHELFSQSPVQSVTQTVESDFQSPTEIWDSSHELFSQSPVQSVTQTVPKLPLVNHESLTSTAIYSEVGQFPAESHLPTGIFYDKASDFSDSPEELQNDWSLELFSPSPANDTNSVKHVSVLSPAVSDLAVDACISPDLFS